MNTETYLMLMILLFAVGALGFLLRRNAIIAFMSVKLMLNAANLVFVTLARQYGKLDGQMMSFFVMVVTVVGVVAGLAIIVAVYRARCSASVDDVNLLEF